MKTLIIAIAAIASIIWAYPAPAQSVSLVTLSGGARSCSGGGIACDFTIAEPVVGRIAGGVFTVSFGFVAATATSPPPCPTDLNGDRATNTADLTLLLLRFGQSTPPGSPGAIADLNDDGVVNTADLTLLLLRFGQACS